MWTVLLALWWAAAAPARAGTAAQPQARRQAFERSMTWCDRIWDERAGLLLFAEEDGRPRHQVRESVWYAAGLLERRGPGDVGRALSILDRALALQYRAPARREYGSFPEATEDPAPPARDPVRLKDYDPNWRQFIGTTLAVIEDDFGADLTPALTARVDEALRAAVEGARADAGWITPDYTNIALMQAFLLDREGARQKRAPWRDEGRALAAAIRAGFARHGTFPEYNSPTYYGVDLFALALWRSRAPSRELRRWGGRLEAALWRDTARYYHAGLMNLSGPYDRSYGMDMRRYASLVGLLLLGEIGPQRAPFPPSDDGMGHALDFAWGPMYALVPTVLPEDARRRFLAFDGPRAVEATIEDAPPKRATAWLGQDAMWGAMTTPNQGQRPDQLRAVTAHWRLPDGQTGWLALRPAGPIRAEASKDGLTLAVAGRDLAFDVFASTGAAASAFTAGAWTLPGRTWSVDSDAGGFSVEPSAEPGTFSVVYRGARRLSLRPSPKPL